MALVMNPFFYPKSQNRQSGMDGILPVQPPIQQDNLYSQSRIANKLPALPEILSLFLHDAFPGSF